MRSGPENPASPSDEPNEATGASLAAWRQIYYLAKEGAEGFSLDKIPGDLLLRFQEEDSSPKE